MATLFSDNFNRADDTTISSNWNDASDSQLLSNQLRMGTTNNPGRCSVNTTGMAAVADCKVTIKRITGSGFDGGPGCRCANSAIWATGYYIDVYSSSTIDLYRRVSDADTLVATRTSTHAANDTYSILASGSGATVTLRIFQNGSQLGADISDSNAARITTAGQAGVVSWATNIDFDDILVEDLGAAAADPPLAFAGADIIGSLFQFEELS